MPSFMENFLRQLVPIRDQGVFYLPSTADRPLASVATRDIAAAQNTQDVYDLAPGTPRTATSFRQWCQEVLRPAVKA